MESIIEKIYYISAEPDRMQKFIEFIKKVHDKSRCGETKCDVNYYLKEAYDRLFNEKLSYDSCKIKFTDICLSYPFAFCAMFQLHCKQKDNIENSPSITNKKIVTNKQIERNNQLIELIQQKYVTQKKIDALVESLFLNK